MGQTRFIKKRREVSSGGRGEGGMKGKRGVLKQSIFHTFKYCIL